MNIFEAIETIERGYAINASLREAFQLVIDDARNYNSSGWADELSICRANNAELQRERDEARRTCTLVRDDFSRVERERDDLRAVVTELRVRIVELNGQLDEKVKRIGELEAELAASTDRERQWREWRQGDKNYVATSPAADWRKTLNAAIADSIERALAGNDDTTVGGFISELLRWEPKS